LHKLSLIVFISCLSIGCASSFSEKHYFKSVDAQGTPINYYRLNVKGRTFLASSRYLSGYFDETALDAYFSEITQPDNALFSESISNSEGNVTPLSDNLKGKKLILLLSSNSDAIAEQIGQFANNQEIMNDLTRLIHRDQIRETLSAQSAADLQEIKGDALADIGQRIILGMDEGADVATVQANILFYVNRLASEFGNTTPFKDLDEAKIWLEYSRTKIQEGF
jgi:hypothetical protein